MSAGFATLADTTQAWFRRFEHGYSGLIWFTAPAGFALIAYLARRYFPNSQGSGIPQCIAAGETANDALRQRLLSFRVAAGKVMLTAAGFLFGASIGREGPSVQVGASLMWGLRSSLEKEHKALILAGSAAGIAAAFNAPLAGVVFAIEELSRSFEARTSGLILTATILAGAAAMAVTGNYDYFGETTGTISHWQDWLSLGVIAIAGGLLGGLFSRAVIAMAFNPVLRRVTGAARRPILFAAACGFVVALCGWLSGGLTYGAGYQEAFDIIHHDSSVAWFYVPLKILATTASAVSGIPGGLFSPSLSVGAGIGAVAAEWLPFSAGSETQFALLGMAAYLTGVVQSPITSVVIMAEMTGNNRMVLPLLACAIVAQAVSRAVCPTSIYHALAEGFLLKERDG
ncbi:chloride channel protein [Aestuariivirga sp.]|uniref:chloride channel protein n=1 Tax=Aestuariivirga sp. TaxID=2650926 RepID=UPI003BA8B60A